MPAHQAAAGEPSSVLALRWQARALAPMPMPPQPSPSQPSTSARWLVGTSNPREQNELDAVEYNPTASSQHEPLRCIASWAHPAEVWAVAAHPSEFATSGLVATAWQAAATALHCRQGSGSGGADDAARAARPGWGVTVWRAPVLDAGTAASRTAALARACDLEERGGATDGASASAAAAAAAVPVRAVAWSPHAADELLTADADGTLRTWRVGDGGEARVQSSVVGRQDPAARGELWAAEPHPTEAGLAAAATGAGVLVWDARAGAPVGSFGCPSTSSSSSSSCPSCGLARWRVAARCVSWAPPQGGGGSWRLASAGDDGRLRFWDLRTLSSSSLTSQTPRCVPLQTLGGAHGHAVTALAHHPQHEALLASAGSDGVAALWHVPRVAAGVVTAVDGDGAEGDFSAGGASKEQDGRVWSFDDPAAGGDDALRGVAWAAAAANRGGGGGGGGDAWALAALAHDGRVAVHHVPRSVRYAVLV